MEIKKEIFEQLKNMAKNYKKDTVAIRDTNIKYQKEIWNLKKEIDRLIKEEKENIKK